MSTTSNSTTDQMVEWGKKSVQRRVRKSDDVVFLDE